MSSSAQPIGIARGKLVMTSSQSEGDYQKLDFCQSHNGFHTSFLLLREKQGFSQSSFQIWSIVVELFSLDDIREDLKVSHQNLQQL